MGYSNTLHRQRYRRFGKCLAVGAVIFLAISSGAAQTTTARSTLPQHPALDKYPGLLTEFGVLLERLRHEVQLPPALAPSHLLPLLPESTTLYGAFPNYGDASHQALTIFQDEMQGSPVLRDWWQHGEMALAGPKL